MEIWKDIKGYEGKYQISSLGRVKSLARKFANGKTDIILKTKIELGYEKVSFSENNKTKTCRVHRLVAEAFIPIVKDKDHVNHIDGNKSNNKAENLEWCTPKENAAHAIKTGLINYENKTRPIKGVDKFSLDGKYIESYPSQIEALAKNGLDRNYISSVCNGHTKQYGGFMWRHSKDIGEIKHDIESIVKENRIGLHTGIYINKRNGKWIASINKNKKKIYLGIYAIYEEALQARLKAEKELFV